MRIQWRTRKSVTPREIALEVEDILRKISKTTQRLDSLETTSSVNVSIGDVNLRRGVAVTVGEGSNTITFSSPFATTNYAITFSNVKVSSSEAATINEVSRTAGSITIYCNGAGTIDYIAVEGA